MNVVPKLTKRGVPRKPRVRCTAQNRETIIAMTKDGFKAKVIAELLGISEVAVSRVKAEEGYANPRAQERGLRAAETRRLNKTSAGVSLTGQTEMLLNTEPLGMSVGVPQPVEQPQPFNTSTYIINGITLVLPKTEAPDIIAKLVMVKQNIS